MLLRETLGKLRRRIMSCSDKICKLLAALPKYRRRRRAERKVILLPGCLSQDIFRIPFKAFLDLLPQTEPSSHHYLSQPLTLTCVNIPCVTWRLQKGLVIFSVIFNVSPFTNSSIAVVIYPSTAPGELCLCSLFIRKLPQTRDVLFFLAHIQSLCVGMGRSTHLRYKFGAVIHFTIVVRKALWYTWSGVPHKDNSLRCWTCLLHICWFMFGQFRYQA